MSDKPDNIANQEFNLHLIGDEVVVLMTVLKDWADSHKDEPEAQEMIEKLKTMRPVRIK